MHRLGEACPSTHPSPGADTGQHYKGAPGYSPDKDLDELTFEAAIVDMVKLSKKLPERDLGRLMLGAGDESLQSLILRAVVRRSLLRRR